MQGPIGFQSEQLEIKHVTFPNQLQLRSPRMVLQKRGS
jgi:hypothetical protein